MTSSPIPAPRGLSAYLRQSRDLLTSVVLILPLFFAYQIGVLTTGGIKNGVDFMTDVLLLLTGQDLFAYLAVNVGVLAALLVLVFILRGSGTFRPRIFPWVILESTVYALFFGSAVALLIRAVGLDVLLAIGMSRMNALVLSIGAGLYEELVFRLFVMGGLYVGLVRGLKQSPLLSGLVALVISSLLFSAVHHIGSLGEPFTLSAFTFRFFAGVVLAAIFWLRGLAVAVYTHAIYDVIVLVVRGS